MLDDLDNLDRVQLPKAVTSDKPSYSGGGGNKNFSKFQKKEEVVEDPYKPVTMFIDKDFPTEIKDKLCRIAGRFLNKGFTVRINGDDKEVVTKLRSLSDKHVEVYTAWKGFNDIESKHYYNTLTSKHLAQVGFQAWDKIPDVVKSMLARNVRMVFGDKNNSITMVVITWGPGGATKTIEVTKDTGRAGNIIKMASSHGFSVVNVSKDNAEDILDRYFNIGVN